MDHGIGRWQLVGELGRGDFATVHRAVCDDMTAALKICTYSDASSRERLDVETAVLGLLDHRGIPRLYDRGDHDGRGYLVMGLVTGETVKTGIERRDAEGAVFGDLQAMRLVGDLLEILSYLHDAGHVHRDIKEANVLVDADGKPSLIDFGFCKPTGSRAIRTTDSYHRVGSARFSPPRKLDNPGLAVPSHDVFAVGVIAYRLLTAAYPWSSPADEDRAALARLWQEQPLVPVRDHNSRVLGSVSHLVSRLLVLNDEWRPTAAEALTDVRRILHDEQRSRGSRFINIRYPHVVRDPVYGDVRLTDEEYAILDTPQMQRLRVIKQLGLTDMVYPSATHTRLGHAIGCVERVEQILSTVERLEGIRVDPEIRLVARLYALVHDVTHIPFGHTIEDELGFFDRHDENLPRFDRLVASASSELGGLLRHTDQGRAVIGLLNREGLEEWRLVSELVSGLTGADVLDYIDRDALFCGLDHRIDSALVRQFRLQAVPGSDGQRLVSLIAGKYGVRMDRNFAVESVLRERYAMFLKVYTHSAKVAGSALLGKALAAVAPARSGTAKPVREDQLESIGDESLLDHLATKAAAKIMVQQLRRRQFPRGVYRAALLEENRRSDTLYEQQRSQLATLGVLDWRGRAGVEARIAQRAKVPADRVIVYCPAKAPGHQRVEHWVTFAPHQAPTRATLDEFSQRHLGLWDLWVFVVDTQDRETRNAVAEAAQEFFGYPNRIAVDRRQGRLF